MGDDSKFRVRRSRGKAWLNLLPPGAWTLPRGVLSATDICLKGELISIPPAPLWPAESSVLLTPFGAAVALAGDELKNKGEDDRILFCREDRGVASDSFGCKVRLLRVDRAGVADKEFLWDLREAGEDIVG